MGRREFIAGIGATCLSLHLASLLAAQVAGITMAAAQDSTLQTFRAAIFGENSWPIPVG
jgi:hypothetical protein